MFACLFFLRCSKCQTDSSLGATNDYSLLSSAVSEVPKAELMSCPRSPVVSVTDVRLQYRREGCTLMICVNCQRAVSRYYLNSEMGAAL